MIPDRSSNSALIGGSVGGGVALLLIVGLGLFLSCRRRDREAVASVSLDAVGPQSNYGRFPDRRDPEYDDAAGVQARVAHVYEAADSVLRR
jgi:hypothetical protein